MKGVLTSPPSITSSLFPSLSLSLSVSLTFTFHFPHHTYSSSQAGYHHHFSAAPPLCQSEYFFTLPGHLFTCIQGKSSPSLALKLQGETETH